MTADQIRKGGGGGGGGYHTAALISTITQEINKDAGIITDGGQG